MNEETILQPAEPIESAGAAPAQERQTILGTGRVDEQPDVLARIASHPDLTPAMRQRLADLVQRQPPDDGPHKFALDDVLAILAETVPSTLRLAAGELSPAPHPEGESFFTGDPASDADRQAAAVATEQLALSGLLRRT